jgi:Cys-tRNA(Pro)/Cys-tRNA(Cys) deacylase
MSAVHPSVLRHLQQAQLPFIVHKHADYPGPIRSPQDFAQALGYPIERISKSLFLAAGQNQHAISLCSINKKSNFAPLADRLGWGRLEVAATAELSRVTGYPSHGVSPFGVSLPTFVDSHLMSFETILVGAGQVGVEIELSPHDLVAATSAVVLDFARA